MIKKKTIAQSLLQKLYIRTPWKVKEFLISFLKKQAGIATMKSTLLNLIAAFASTTAFHRLS